MWHAPGTALAAFALAACSTGEPSGATPSKEPAAVASARATAAPAEPVESAAAPGATATASAAASAAAAPSAAAEAPEGKAKAGAEIESPKTESPKIEDASFSVWMQGPATVKAGEKAEATVVLVPQGGYKCNAEYPYKLKLDAAPEGLTYPEPVVRGAAMTVTPKRGTMRVPFVATSAGKKTIAGKFYFSVCTDAQCKIENRPVALTVQVE